MFEWPIGVPNLILLVGWAFLLVLGRLRGVSYGARHWRLSGLSLFLATVAMILIVTDRAVGGLSENGIYLYDRSNHLRVLFVLFASLAGHINFRFDRRRLELELAPISVMATFLAIQLIYANNLMILAIGLPAFILVSTCSVFSDPQTKTETLSSYTIIFSVISFCLICVACGLFYSQFKSLEIHRLANELIPIEKRKFFLLGWGLIFLSALSLLAIPVLNPFNRYFMNSGSWSIFGYFHSIMRYTGAILILKWFSFIESTPVLNDILSGGWPGQWPRLSVSFGVVLLLFVTLLLLILRRAAFLADLWFLIPFSLVFIGAGAESELLKFGLFLVLVQSIFATHLCTKVLMDIGILMSDSLKDVREKLRLASPIQRLQLFGALVFQVPIGSYIGHAMVQSFLKNWATGDWSQATTIQIILVAFFLLSLVFSLAISAWILSTLLTVRSRSAAAPPIVGFDFLWNLALFFPLIVVGIYPTPLYNYVLNYLGK